MERLWRWNAMLRIKRLQSLSCWMMKALGVVQRRGQQQQHRHRQKTKHGHRNRNDEKHVVSDVLCLGHQETVWQRHVEIIQHTNKQHGLGCTKQLSGLLELPLKVVQAGFWYEWYPLRILICIHTQYMHITSALYIYIVPSRELTCSHLGNFETHHLQKLLFTG